MTQTRKSPATFTATEALAAFRRVKLTASSGTAVEYADQSDSSSFIGYTLEAAALGAQVSVQLNGQAETVKGMSADTFAVGATLYAADDGKVSDTSSGLSIGTALEASTAAGDVIEILPDAAAGSQPTPSSVAVYGDATGGIPFLVAVDLAGAATTAIWSAACPRNILVLDAFSINTGAGGGTWKLSNGTNDICSAVTTAASDTDIDRAADMDDAYNEIAAGGTLSVIHTGASLAATLYVWCLPTTASA